MEAKLMDRIKEQLVRHEGLRLKPDRWTVGKLTIGIGRNLDDCWISQSEAYVMLINDIMNCEKQLQSKFPDIYNNIIRANGINWYSGSSAVAATGLVISQSERIYAAHNSVEISSPSNQSYVASISGTRNIFRKNHFVNLDGGYSLNFINTEPDVTNRNLVEYNNIYASGTYLGKRSNTSYKEMSEMIPLFDSYNADLNPFFEDEYLRSNAPRLNNLGFYAGIDEDFFGNPRSDTAPDIGAHEYDIDSLDPLLAPMEGDYTIGVGGDYPTVSDFAVALAFRGINNPITADLSETNYNEQVNFDRIPGSGHDRVITIRKSPFIGAGNATTISYSAQTANDNYVLIFPTRKCLKN